MSMKRLNLNDLANILDSTIEKGNELKERDLIKSKKEKEEIRKALSHNPFSPVDMGVDSEYYNPYKYSYEDGAFLPYSADYWYEQGKNPEVDSYNTVKQFYGEKLEIQQTLNRFADLRRSVDNDLLKSDKLKQAYRNRMRDEELDHSIQQSSINHLKSALEFIHGKNIPEEIGHKLNSYAEKVEKNNPYKKKIKTVEENINSVPHSVDVEFMVNGKKMSHSFQNVHGVDEDDASERVHRELTKTLPHIRVGHLTAKKQIKKSIESDLFKGKTAQIGETRIWSGVEWQKVSDGKWVPKAKNRHSSKEEEAGKRGTAKVQGQNVNAKEIMDDSSHRLNVQQEIDKVKTALIQKIESEVSAEEKKNKVGNKIDRMFTRDVIPKNGTYRPKKSLGISRRDMPQIEDEYQGKFLDYLNLKNIGYSKELKTVSDLKPSQNEMSVSASRNLIGTEKIKKPLIVSNDGYVIDGHHRWLANMISDEEREVEVISIDMDAESLIREMKKFPRVKQRDINNVTTTELHKNEAGEYDQDRKQLHDKIIKEKTKNVKPVPPPEGQKPIAIFTAGGSGSGKSSVMKVTKQQLGDDLVHVDADDIKNDIPEYINWVKQKDDSAAFKSHDESSDLANELIKQSVKESKPFIFDSTMKNIEKFTKIINMLKEAGYEIHIAMADVPVEVAKERAAQRAKKTGRVVPDSIIEESNAGAIKAFHALKGLVDSAVIYSTVGDGPEEVYRVDANGETSMAKDEIKEQMRKRGHLIKSEKAEKKVSNSDIYNKFAEAMKNAKFNYNLEDNTKDDPDFEKEIKYSEE